VAARVDILRPMLPRLRQGSAFFVHAASVLLAPFLLAGLLVGCDGAADNDEPKPPATNVPHGTIDLASNTAAITPRARAVAALEANARAAGHRFFTVEDKDNSSSNPLAVVIEVDLRKFEPVLLTRPGGTRPGLAVAEPHTNVVIGSGFVSPVRAMEPIGLLQHDDEVLSGIEQHGYTRILGISAQPARFTVVHRSQWLPDMFRSALQAGPGIVEKGKLDISERDLERPKYFRSFVAECGDRALAGISVVPTHLHTLGTALVELFAREDLQCSEVVNLAGDREAVLLVSNQTTAAYFGDPQPRKAALIAFHHRSEEQTEKKAAP